MKRLVAIFLMLLGGCCSHNDYDSYFIQLIKKAQDGDVNSASEAYIYCISELKLDDPKDLVSSYMGRCGGALALWSNLALESGDPEVINDVIGNVFLVSDDLKPRVPFMLDVARVSISKRCGQQPYLKSCQDRQILEKLGIHDGISK